MSLTDEPKWLSESLSFTLEIWDSSVGSFPFFLFTSLGALKKYYVSKPGHCQNHLVNVY